MKKSFKISGIKATANGESHFASLVLEGKTVVNDGIETRTAPKFYNLMLTNPSALEGKDSVELDLTKWNVRESNFINEETGLQMSSLWFEPKQ